MAKIIKFIAIVGVLAAGVAGGMYYKDTYMGQAYYTQVSTNVQPTTMKDNSGKSMGEVFTYNEKAFNDKGEARDLEWNAFEDKAFPVGTWVKVDASKKRTIGYKVIKQNEVPEKAQKSLGA
ncbi:hypothetical protein WCNC_01072 [Weissella ceti NC36]|uniref:YxeA family protein n=1 Tax=Weissella ceti TaxID=759620 RepID=UPI0002AA71AD|nr:YxeA family protein [Weissella ceti]ELA07828.1 hypothetical protein WCNC_01072 [Weissella ceti NC36]